MGRVWIEFNKGLAKLLRIFKAIHKAAVFYKGGCESAKSNTRIFYRCTLNECLVVVIARWRKHNKFWVFWDGLVVFDVNHCGG